MEWTNLNYVVHSSELASELVVDTKFKPCALLVHKGVTFSLSTTVYAVNMPKFIRNYRLLFKTFYIDTLCVFILNVIDNDLGSNYGVSRVLIMIYHRFCKKYFPWKWVVLTVYYIWYKTFIENYYFLCV